MLAVALEALAIMGPLYIQLVIDEVIVRRNVNVLAGIAFGFGLLALISAAAMALRRWALLAIQNEAHFQTTARLFGYLLRLPAHFFKSRHFGDVMSRFDAIGPICKQTLDSLVACLIDGVMATATLMVMFAYSPALTGVVTLALVLYLLLRLKLLEMYRNRSEALIWASSDERLIFAETLLGMPNLKLFDPQLENEQRWVNCHAVVVNAHFALGRAKITYKTLEGLIFGVENIIVIYFAAQMALTGILTVGMISAFIVYKAQFVQKVILAIDHAIELQLLRSHFERMADIALYPLDKVEGERSATYTRRIEGRIELRNLSFHYPGSPSLVLENVNFTLHPQQTWTITGPSGSGKSTLIKIMLGLLSPTSGEILIDGVPLRNIDILCYRNQVLAVLPNDRLISGSVVHNISSYPDVNSDRMSYCGKIAGVHDEIMAMPMGYNSLVGPMGNALSDGQKHRILLARALYRDPKILFLDRGSANLDEQKQQEINEIFDGSGSHASMSLTHGKQRTAYLSQGRADLFRDGCCY